MDEFNPEGAVVEQSDYSSILGKLNFAIVYMFSRYIFERISPNVDFFV